MKAINVAMISQLVCAGADVNMRDLYGFEPLHLAAGGKSFEVVKALLDAGADVHARTTGGETPLHWAAEWGKNSDVIMALLRAGADANAENKDKKTPFDLVKGNEKIKNTTAYWKLNDAQWGLKETGEES